MKLNLLRLWVAVAILLTAPFARAQPVTAVSVGFLHSLFLKEDGSLWAMGSDSNGQLGDGRLNSTNIPEQIIASNVTAVAAGRHSLLLKADGSLWAMGFNLYGQLGDGTYFTTSPFGTNQPEQIVASNVTTVAAGIFHSLFIKGDGSLWAMGDNRYGQLGDGTTNNTNLPEQIIATNVVAIAAGYYHSLFLKGDGSLWVMGHNNYGQLGDGTTNDCSQPEQIVNSNVMAIAGGESHSLFLKKDGSLWGMGYNAYGQLGNGIFSFTPPYGTNRPQQSIASNVTAIAAGNLHSLFIKKDGSLWGMGYNGVGQLGNGNTTDASLPVQISIDAVQAIDAGDYDSMFIKKDGSLWGMGQNNVGQLGDGSKNNTNRPALVVVPVTYNQISGQLLTGGNMQLFFSGIGRTNYALDRSFTLSPPTWIPQQTNPAGGGGALVFTNTPVVTTNNFWRIRSVP
jgi:alpha-tubulin suppressor-like RCC1 family protein